MRYLFREIIFFVLMLCCILMPGVAYPSSEFQDALEKGDTKKVAAMLSRDPALAGARVEESYPILIASDNGYREIVELILSRGADVNARGVLGETALHLASAKGYYEIVEILLGKGAFINARRSDGVIPLHLAASEGHLKVVRLLIEHGADVGSVALEDCHKTPLIYAAEGDAFDRRELSYEEKYDKAPEKRAQLISDRHSSCLEIARLLIQKGASVTAKDDYLMTALHYAAHANNTGLAELLLSKGLDVDNTDPRIGITPLHCAAAGRSKEMIELLKAKGASVSAVDDDGRTPLDCACGYVDQLYMGYHTIEDEPSDVNITFGGYIPLHWMLVKGNEAPVVETLIRLGSNVNATDHSKATPIFYSMQKDVTETLIAHGADVNARASIDATPLHIAAMKRTTDVARALIYGGADISAKTTNGRTPLHCAAISGSGEMVELLLEKGAIINEKDSGGRTPLHCAANYGNLETAEILVKRGALLNEKDGAGNTPLKLAKNYGCAPSLVELLIKSGAKE